MALLELQRWDEAWDWHESRLLPRDPTDLDKQAKVSTRNYHGPDGMTPWWDGKTKGLLVIHGEQGLGDEIMFMSCIPDVLATGCDVVIECAPRLERLFKRNFEAHSRGPTKLSPPLVVGTHKLDGSEWIADTPPTEHDGAWGYGKPDFKIAMGSLPKFFRRTEESFPRVPYLTGDAARAQEIQKMVPANGQPRVGISWQGGVERTHVWLRSLPLPNLKLLLQQPVNWVSLQYTPDAAKEVAEFEAESGIKIHHWPEIVEAPADYDETAAVVAGLDLVITVCQSVIHLCGAMGVPCWVLTPAKPDWRLGLTRSSPAWYGPHVRLFRRAPEDEDWGPVLERIAGELDLWLKEKAA